MNQELVKEIEYEKDILVKSGFYSESEILEVLEDQFMDEEVDFSEFNISIPHFDNSNFSKLEFVFESLAKEDIVSIHNCGFNIEDGIDDVFELYVHLKNNKFNPRGFCFYTFEDIEQAIWDDKLQIAFGDFENNPKLALQIGKTVASSLKEYFEINWTEDINTPIEVISFKWDKLYVENKEYEIEGAFEVFTNR